MRALFLFADGEPIGEEGLKHLKAHVAACADGTSWSRIKKPSDLNLAKRVEWTELNLPLLRKIGEAALRGDDTIKWALPKKPYQFIAACLELVQALDKGPDFITRLPLTFDASCSGLQHLCAMTRDEKGARYVNLIPSLYRPPDAAETGDIRKIIGAPTTEETEDAHQVADDFYQRVAGVVSQNSKCLEVMDGALDRAIVKQPSMSYFYGAVPGGFVKN